MAHKVGVVYTSPRPCAKSRICGGTQHTATLCNTLQHTATHRNTLQHTATHCNTLQHAATHSYLRQHATHCNTLQHSATHWKRTATLYICEWHIEFVIFTVYCSIYMSRTQRSSGDMVIFTRRLDNVLNFVSACVGTCSRQCVKITNSIRRLHITNSKRHELNITHRRRFGMCSRRRVKITNSMRYLQITNSTRHELNITRIRDDSASARVRGDMCISRTPCVMCISRTQCVVCISRTECLHWDDTSVRVYHEYDDTQKQHVNICSRPRTYAYQ